MAHGADSLKVTSAVIFWISIHMMHEITNSFIGAVNATVIIPLENALTQSTAHKECALRTAD
jgi:hypothetical protein